MMLIWSEITTAITQTTGKSFNMKNQRAVGGGCINTAYIIDDGERSFFVKLNRSDGLAMFEAEQAGLQEMADSNSIRVPVPVCSGIAGNNAYLVMESLSFSGRQDQTKLGQQLAAMHRQQAEQFGWHRDNTIGSTPQVNSWMTDWLEFYKTNRIQFQLDLAARRGIGSSLLNKGEKLLADMDKFFSSYQPVPSLLHGDLWSGNVSAMNGEPVIYDPAVYYGDREADIAMTELFGGFSQEFYNAYNQAWTMDSGYKIRKTLYNLYHILNHFNLFGGGYASQAESMIDGLLRY